MRVVSGLADLDFHVAKLGRDGPHLVVRGREDGGVPTTVYVDRDDVVAALKALLTSPAALAFLLTAPFRRASRGSTAPSAGAPRAPVDDVNNPWR